MYLPFSEAAAPDCWVSQEYGERPEVYRRFGLLGELRAAGPAREADNAHNGGTVP